MPLAAHAVWSGARLVLNVALGATDERPTVLRARVEAEVRDLLAAEALGLEAAAQLRAQGAEQLLPAH